MKPGMTPARALYSALLRVFTVAYLFKLWWRGRREPGYRHAVPARLGYALPPMLPGALWVHAVSLGETLAAAALIAALREQRPGLRLLLTHGTATGLEAGRPLLRDGDTQTWLPLDTPGAVRRFLGHAQPSVGVLMETEIWPNLLAVAAASGVPMVLANARLNERSARAARRFAPLLRPAAESLTLALAQSAVDAERIVAAGVRRVQICGNLKFDLEPSPDLQARGRAWRLALSRPVVGLMNSREGEEAQLFAAWAGAGWLEAPLRLIVPRHPQRFDTVFALAQAAGLRVVRRSAWGDTADAEALGADAWIGDSLGEMAAYYSMADVALLGGSFLPLGGHNLIEAAANGCPLVAGPSTFNFAEAMGQAVEEGAAWRASDMESALRDAASVLADAPKRQIASNAGLAFANAHRGASARMAKAILAVVDERGPLSVPEAG